MKTSKDRFFEYAQEEPIVPDEQTSAFVRYLDLLSSIVTENFYVLDIPQKQLPTATCTSFSKKNIFNKKK
ncbi:hypothetical protein [Parabacteroides sp. Marseille-P3160]|uniref:hypothetical protein n=1 Tax=Parabacteroides sp. Marseille-P3160 TaxID=1917887 RepID=UPI0009BA7D37|nr:hypothetical protein [Parabacteroides sp. Marseille-P3160]